MDLGYVATSAENGPRDRPLSSSLLLKTACLDATRLSRSEEEWGELLECPLLIAAGIFGLELDKQIRHRAARQISLKNVIEVLPHPDNRVVLSGRRDALGVVTRRNR